MQYEARNPMKTFSDEAGATDKKSTHARASCTVMLGGEIAWSEGPLELGNDSQHIVWGTVTNRLGTTQL